MLFCSDEIAVFCLHTSHKSLYCLLVERIGIPLDDFHYITLFVVSGIAQDDVGQFPVFSVAVNGATAHP